MSTEQIKVGQRWIRKSDGKEYWVRTAPTGAHGWVRMDNGDGRFHQLSASGLLAKYTLAPAATH